MTVPHEALEGANTAPVRNSGPEQLVLLCIVAYEPASLGSGGANANSSWALMPTPSTTNTFTTPATDNPATPLSAATRTSPTTVTDPEGHTALTARYDGAPGVQ